MVLRVLSDALTTANARQVTLLGLLDMSAAFDCVDHSILLQRLEKTFGVTGLVLQWLMSFLTDRTQQVAYQGTLSKLQRLLYGVLQGWVLGPLLFNLYAADISKVVESTATNFISTLTTVRSISLFQFPRKRQLSITLRTVLPTCRSG